jgi:hypothetical protein
MMTADSNKVKYFFLRNPNLSSNPLSHMRPTNLHIFIDIRELGTAGRAIKQMESVLIPISDQTHGHGRHAWAAVWQQIFEGIAGRFATPRAGSVVSGFGASTLFAARRLRSS